MSNGIIRVKSINSTTNTSARPDITGSSPVGEVKSYGADIHGLTLIEPKVQTINVSSGSETSVIFNYSGGVVQPDIPEPEEPDITDCIAYVEASTVTEGETFMKDCLGGKYIYESGSGTPPNNKKLEWINFLNKGYWDLFKRFPQIKQILDNRNMYFDVKLFHEEPDSDGMMTGGYFSPEIHPDAFAPSGGVYVDALEDPETFIGILIAYNTYQNVSDVASNAQHNFDIGWGSTSHPHGTVFHEFGHALHAINAGLYRFMMVYQEMDPDGYGPGKAPELTSNLENRLVNKLSQYSIEWFPLEFVSEFFALLVALELGSTDTHGADTDSILNSLYDEVEGHRLGGL